MKGRSYLALGLLLALPVWAEEAAKEASANHSVEAVAILEKADTAAKAVGAVRFHSVTEPSGLVTNFIGAAEGTALISGWDELTQRPQHFRMDVTTTMPRAEEATKLSGGGNGESYFIVDHGTKKGYEDMDPGVLGSGGQALLSIAMSEFVRPDPYDNELGADSIELLPSAQVNGEDCYVIKVTYASGGGGAEVGSTWSFAQSDYLPRRRVRHFEIPQQGKGDLVVTLSKLEIDPKLDLELFEMTLPEGYEVVDDFAP